MTNPKVAIILLNYNNYSQTEDCINSLRNIDYDNYIIVVVDNKSTNESVAILKAYEDENTIIIPAEKNGGFAAGNNIGIKYAISLGAEYFLLLNNDTTVEKDFLSILVSSANDLDRIGITTSRIMYGSEPQKIWYAGGEMDYKNVRGIHLGIRTDEVALYSEKREVTYISGCCMLISKEMILEIGGLPEEYFMYYEDMDYCLNAMNSGYRLYYVPNSVIYHWVGSSSGGEESSFTLEWSNRSRRKLLNKYKKLFSNHVVVYLRCEIKQLIKIFIAKNKKVKFKAYTKSFNKQVN